MQMLICGGACLQHLIITNQKKKKNLAILQVVKNLQ